MEVNYFFRESLEEETEMQLLVREKYLTRSWRDRQNAVIFYRLIEQLVLQKPLTCFKFNIRSAKMYMERTDSKLYFSIKDPFVKALNYGREMIYDPDNIKVMIFTFKKFLKFVVKDEVEKFMHLEAYSIDDVPRTDEGSNTAEGSKSGTGSGSKNSQ